MIAVEAAISLYIARRDPIYIIKPHYRSEGPRQGSCRVFGGMFHTIKTITMEYLIEELARNQILRD